MTMAGARAPALRVNPTADNPFDLAADRAYQQWRDSKLRGYPQTIDDLMVEIGDPLKLTVGEREAIRSRCQKTNMAVFSMPARLAADKHRLRALGEAFGLHRLDGNLCADDDSITSLRVMSTGRHQGYIPYTDRPLSWHTDGYYNPPHQRIRAFILLCVEDAPVGGDSALLDPEIAYLLMRDADPAYIAALMQPDVMTIPANLEGEVELRGAQQGPVFCLDSETGSLHMRYTARKRNIQWKTDAATRGAVRFLEGLLAEAFPYVFRRHLEPGQGIICNNVLHSRTAFRDDGARGRRRLMYRARYYDRLANTAGWMS